MTGSRPSVGVAAAVLCDGSGGSTTDPRSFIVKNPSANTTSIDLGGSGVTSGAGFELDPGESVEVDLYGSQLWAIAAAATTVYVLATRG